jgi:hypothetical protein
MIRRAAQEPEPTRLLEEAVGGALAAWETVRASPPSSALRTAPACG